MLHEKIHQLGGKLMKVSSEIDLKWSFFISLFGIQRSHGMPAPSHPYCKPERPLTFCEKKYMPFPLFSFLQ